MKDDLPYGNSGMLPASIDLVQGYDYAYWLIDPILYRPKIELITNEGWHVEPIRIQDKNIAEEDYPYLVTTALDRMQKHADVFFNAALKEQQACMQGASARSYSAWISSDQSAKKLAAKLANHAILKTDVMQKRIFRYWDPRVLQHALGQPTPPMILPTAVNTLWTFIDSIGNIRQVTNKDTVNTAISNPIDQTDMRWLQLVDKRNRLFKLICKHAESMSANKLWEKLDMHLSAVEILTVNRIEDHVVLAAMRHQHQVALEFSPTIQECIKQSQQHEIPLSAILLDWDEDDWQIVEAECEETNKRLDIV